MFELWEQHAAGSSSANHAVRVLFNGHALSLGGACGDEDEVMCEWTAWQELLLTLIPTKHQCPEFYAAYIQ